MINTSLVHNGFPLYTFNSLSVIVPYSLLVLVSLVPSRAGLVTSFSCMISGEMELHL